MCTYFKCKQHNWELMNVCTCNSGCNCSTICVSWHLLQMWKEACCHIKMLLTFLGDKVACLIWCPWKMATVTKKEARWCLSQESWRIEALVCTFMAQKMTQTVFCFIDSILINPNNNWKNLANKTRASTSLLLKDLHTHTHTVHPPTPHKKHKQAVESRSAFV